jgi:predicted ABC-type ATPase
MFDGPNGSGKSVLKSYLPEPLLGFYLNPDENEARGYRLWRRGLKPLSLARNSR